MFPTWYLPMVLLRMMTVRCIFIMPPVIRACTLLPRPLAKLLDFAFKTPADLLRSRDCVAQRVALIEKNQAYLNQQDR